MDFASCYIINVLFLTILLDLELRITKSDSRAYVNFDNYDKKFEEIHLDFDCNYSNAESKIEFDLTIVKLFIFGGRMQKFFVQMFERPSLLLILILRRLRLRPRERLYLLTILQISFYYYNSVEYFNWMFLILKNSEIFIIFVG
jgi:hypothetical protein